jgi:hypothetical protein
MAFACICVLGGSTPFARRVMMDLGSVRSCNRAWCQPRRVCRESAGQETCTPQ